MELRNGMRFPFEAHQGNRTPFQSNIPGRTFRNPPHPENATHYSAKNRVAVSQALDATLAQGVSPTAGRKGTSPSAARVSLLTSHLRTSPMTTPSDNGNTAGRGRTAKTPLSEQGALKQGGIDLLVMPPKLKGRLPLRGVCSVEQLRRLVKRRNELPRNSPSSALHPSSRS